MNRQISTKINKLLQQWPKGTLVVQSWLEQQDIYRQLSDAYCKHGWLERFEPGVYKRAGDDVSWTGALYTLQREMQLKIHVGAQTALELTGFGYHVTMGHRQSPRLFTPSGDTRKIPTWFKRHFINNKMAYVAYNKLFGQSWDFGLQEYSIDNQYSILVSGHERAIMECLYLAPKHISLEYVFNLMQPLKTLRPDMVKMLLTQCTSIKVKRLFLYFAEQQNQPWFDQLDVSEIDLGKGIRQIGAGGRFVAKYRLSIPDLNKHEGYPEDDTAV
ncbi:MAG: type IV toxin-antitoxin system AbiEi family antitoxin domain-containing protein [Pseudomonadota bacterium]